MKSLLSLFLLMMLACCAAQLQAAEVAELFVAEVPVADQTNQEREKAIQAGFDEVVLRISGEADVLNNYQIQQAQKKAQSYLQRFQFEQKDRQLTLKMVFDPAALRDLLSDAGMPIWSSSRPLVLGWVAIERNGRREVLGAQSASPLVEAMQQQAKKRGLPFILPLMDFEDSALIDVTDVWGRFRDPVKNASGRYGADALLAGRLQQNGGTWQGSWTLILGNDTEYLTVENDSPEQAMIDAIDQVANHLARRFGILVAAGSDNRMAVTISNLRSFESYVKARQYLENLAAVREVGVGQVSQNEVTFRLALVGQADSVLRAISLDDKLRPESVLPMGDNGLEQVYFYQWTD